MKKIFTIFIVFFLALFMPRSAKAVSFADRIPGPHFRAGESIVIDEDLVGDVYVGASTVIVEGKIDGDLLVGGGTVTLNGEVTEDVRVGGGTVVLNGIVGQDVAAGGGSVTFGPSSEVAGSVITGGGMVVFNGEIAGNVLTGAGAAQLAGDFGQDVMLEAGELQVLSSAVISGNLTANYEEKADVSDRAQIMGEQNVERMYRSQKTEQARDKMTGFGKGMNQVRSTMSLVLGLVSGLVIMYLFPKVTDAVTNKIIKKPLPSLGWGFVKLLVLPITTVVLMVTVVGLPLAFMLLMGFAVGMMTSTWVAGKALGEKIYQESKAKWLKDRYLQFVVGLTLIQLLGLLPLVGWLIKLVAFLMGFGALGMWFKDQIKPVKK